MTRSKRQEIENALNMALEDLASVEHARWAHWQRYMHDKASRQPDGSLIVPRELVDQWNRQIGTPYSELSEAEKDSDREQVKKYLRIIVNAIEKI